MSQWQQEMKDSNASPVGKVAARLQEEISEVRHKVEEHDEQFVSLLDTVGILTKEVADLNKLLRRDQSQHHSAEVRADPSYDRRPNPCKLQINVDGECDAMDIFTTLPWKWSEKIDVSKMRLSAPEGTVKRGEMTFLGDNYQPAWEQADVCRLAQKKKTAAGARSMFILLMYKFTSRRIKIGSSKGQNGPQRLLGGLFLKVATNA